MGDGLIFIQGLKGWFFLSKLMNYLQDQNRMIIVSSLLRLSLSLSPTLIACAQGVLHSNLHDHRHMIIHVFIDIAQKARSNHAHHAKGDAGQIHPPVALGVCDLPRSHDNLPRRVVTRDSGDQFDFFKERGAGEGDGGFYGFGIGDPEFQLHGAANVVNGVGDKFGAKDVVVRRVADRAPDDADRQGEGGNGCDEVLRQCQSGEAWGGIREGWHVRLGK